VFRTEEVTTPTTEVTTETATTAAVFARPPVRAALHLLRVLARIGPTATTRLARGVRSIIRVSPAISTTPSATVR
jgi:hypothetical protein